MSPNRVDADAVRVAAVTRLGTRGRDPLWGPFRVMTLFVTALLGSLLLCGVTAPAAHAHAALVDSSPAPGTTDRPVHEVRLRFAEPLTAGLGQVAVTGPEGSVTDGDPVVTGSEIVVPLRPLTVAGTYSVAYRVVAGDGHAEVGGLDVVVSDVSAAAAAKQAATTTTSSSGSEGAGPASRGSRSGAPEQSVPVGSGVPVAARGIDLAVVGGAAAAVLLLLGLHLVLRRGVTVSGRTS
jgi:copper resistance protein C